MSYFSVVAGAIKLTATLLFLSGAYFGLDVGGMERMIVYPVLLAGIAFSGYLIGASNTDQR